MELLTGSSYSGETRNGRYCTTKDVSVRSRRVSMLLAAFCFPRCGYLCKAGVVMMCGGETFPTRAAAVVSSLLVASGYPAAEVNFIQNSSI